jgi:amino acid adenylation domain-containing protein
LTLWLEHTDNGLTGTFEYCTDLFSAASIQRLIASFVTLLDAIVAQPQQCIDALPLLEEAERQRLLLHWNNTRESYPRAAGVHTLFEHQAQQWPDAVAAIFPDSNGVAAVQQQLSYGELEQRANQLAHYLRQRGVASGDLVGLFLDRSPDMLVGLLGVLKAGAGYVPMDPLFPLERLQWMLEDSGAKVVLTQEHWLERLAEIDAPVISLDARRTELAAQSNTSPGLALDPEQAAYVIFTSGSTGRPKGVQVPHRAVVNFLTTMAQSPGFRASDAMLAVTTLSFDIAVLELFLPLVCGGRVVVAGRDDVRDGGRLIKLLETYRVSVAQATPATWRLLLDSGWMGQADLKILCGGEALHPELAEALLARCHSLWNMYGPTETTVWSTIAKVESADQSKIIGRPIGNTQVYILDKQLQPVPIGVAGELHIGGEGVATGYLKRPDLTSARFVADPFSDDKPSRLYKTGDLVRYRDDGNIEFCGRLDHQVKIRGYRIECAEIETALCRHENVQQAVVIACENRRGDPHLLSYYTTSDGAAVPTGELRAVLRKSLPEYMIPSAFIALESFPLTPNRKVDRNRLPAPPEQIERSESFVAPRNTLESQLAKVWEEIVHTHPIGVTDNFFEIGGHSLLVAQLVARIRSQLGIEVTLSKIFELPTVERMAEHLAATRLVSSHIKEHTHSARPFYSVVEVQPLGSRPPLFGVHSTRYRTLANHLGTDQPIYALRYGLAATSGELPVLPDRIEDLAAHYIEEMRRIQPEGPYHLMGLCVAALIAFEMAHQLVAQGQEVALLALFDPVIPAGRTSLAFGSKVHNLFQIGASEAFRRAHQKLRGKVRRLGGIQNESIAREKYHNHVPHRVYPGDVSLFKPADRVSLSHSFAHDLGWGGLVVGELTIHEIPGGHTLMLEEPNVKFLAEKLRDSLTKTPRTVFSAPRVAAQGGIG